MNMHALLAFPARTPLYRITLIEWVYSAMLFLLISVNICNKFMLCCCTSYAGYSSPHYALQRHFSIHHYHLCGLKRIFRQRPRGPSNPLGSYTIAAVLCITITVCMDVITYFQLMVRIERTMFWRTKGCPYETPCIIRWWKFRHNQWLWYRLIQPIWIDRNISHDCNSIIGAYSLATMWYYCSSMRRPPAAAAVPITSSSPSQRMHPTHSSPPLWGRSVNRGKGWMKWVSTDKSLHRGCTYVIAFDVIALRCKYSSTSSVFGVSAYQAL